MRKQTTNTGDRAGSREFSVAFVRLSHGIGVVSPLVRASAAVRVILALGISVAFVIAAAGVAFHYIAVKVPADITRNTKEETFDAAKRVVTGFKSVFNFTPKVTVNGTTVIEQANSVIELATVRQDVLTHYTWSQIWLGSRKSMELQGVYKAKAGFDLRDTFRVAIEDTRITANLPMPKLLSLEMTGYKVLKDENGWWNAVTPADREKAINAMQANARTKAAQSGLLEEAKTKFRQELSDAMKGQNITTPVKINFPGEAIEKARPEM